MYLTKVFANNTMTKSTQKVLSKVLQENHELWTFYSQ